MFTRLTCVGTLAAMVLLAPRPVFAQAQGEIILPIFNVFSVNTTVSAPDRGRISLGGVNRASDIRNEYGAPLFPLRDRGISSTRSAMGVDAQVWIIELDEMERSIAGRTAAPGSPARGFAGGMRGYTVARAANTPAANGKDTAAAKEKAARDEEAAAKVAHAADMLKRGQDAESRGKFKVAALYYKSVVSLEVASSAKLAQERLRGLEPQLAGR